MSVAAKLIQHGSTPPPEGPYLVWENFGCEGWQPRSFATLDEAVRKRRDGECLITKIVEFDVVERGQSGDRTTEPKRKGSPEMTDCRLVMITWLDSRQTNGAWQWLSEFKKMTPVEAVSVGWLIQDDEEVKVVAQSMAPDGDNVQTAGRKTIPSCCVRKIETLIEADLQSGDRGSK